MRIRSSVSAHAWHCGIMVLLLSTVLVVVSLIAVCCSGESDTQLLFTNRQCSFEYRDVVWLSDRSAHVILSADCISEHFGPL